MSFYPESPWLAAQRGLVSPVQMGFESAHRVQDPGAMAIFTLDALIHPIVQAPMGGGPSTPALAAAVSGAGGLGFLAAGYKAVDAVRADLHELRSALPAGVPFGVNVFAPPGRGTGAPDVAAYVKTLRA